MLNYITAKKITTKAGIWLTSAAQWCPVPFQTLQVILADFSLMLRNSAVSHLLVLCGLIGHSIPPQMWLESSAAVGSGTQPSRRELVAGAGEACFILLVSGWGRGASEISPSRGNREKIQSCIANL